MLNISNYKIKKLNLKFNTLTALKNTTILIFFKNWFLKLISPILTYNIIKLIAIIIIINNKSFKSI
jgi:hypothetical protein